MPNFGETPTKPVTETPEEVVNRLAGGLELVPLEGEEGETKKAEEGEKTSTPVAATETPQAIAEQVRVQSETDQAQADALAERIKSGNIGAEMQPATEVKAGEMVVESQEKKTTEEIYGMNPEDLTALIKSDGSLNEEFSPNDPDYKKKYQKMVNHNRTFEQARVKLFDRVLSNEATEEEMKIATDHATEIGKYTGDLSGFKSQIPKAWYTNDRIAEAIAATSPQNKRWVKYVGENYSNEQLRKQFVKIDEDGEVRTYVSQ